MNEYLGFTEHCREYECKHDHGQPELKHESEEDQEVGGGDDEEEGEDAGDQADHHHHDGVYDKPRGAADKRNEERDASGKKGETA